jgi:hypothetical protein
MWGWKAHHQEFFDAFRVGRESSDERVVESLYHRAVGYTYKEGKRQVHMPPDVGACKMWLTNRRSEQWRDKHDITTVAKPPDDGRTPQEKFEQLLRDMLEAGAIAVVHEGVEAIQQQRPLLGTNTQREPTGPRSAARRVV